LGEAKDSVKRREGSDPVVEHELGRVGEILEVHGAPSLTLWSAQRRRPCAAAPPALASTFAPSATWFACVRSGEVDLDTVGVVRAQLDELTVPGFTSAVPDLREVTFLDSSVLHLAMEAHVSGRRSRS
jgi:hypothetical protein